MYEPVLRVQEDTSVDHERRPQRVSGFVCPHYGHEEDVNRVRRYKDLVGSEDCALISLAILLTKVGLSKKRVSTKPAMATMIHDLQSS